MEGERRGDPGAFGRDEARGSLDLMNGTLPFVMSTIRAEEDAKKERMMSEDSIMELWTSRGNEGPGHIHLAVLERRDVRFDPICSSWGGCGIGETRNGERWNLQHLIMV